MTASARPTWQADHARYRRHVETARRCACATGGLCPVGAELARQADASGQVAAWREEMS